MFEEGVLRTVELRLHRSGFAPFPQSGLGLEGSFERAPCSKVE